MRAPTERACYDRAVATYAIGDVQGCFDTLQALLRRIAFDPARDRILLVGDLVNRGPKNVEVLRWAMAHGTRVRTVLGNHDMHLIGRHLGVVGAKRRDTVEDVMSAPDRDVLVGWLRAQPFALQEDGYLLVHAGLLPGWTVEKALALSAEVEAKIQSDDAMALLKLARERSPRRWDDALTGLERARVALQGFTVLRTVWRDGTPNSEYNGGPGGAPQGSKPWFLIEPENRHGGIVLFGHWAALGLHLGAREIGLDTGCVWGNLLTAMRLEDRAVFQEKAIEPNLGGD